MTLKKFLLKITIACAVMIVITISVIWSVLLISVFGIGKTDLLPIISISSAVTVIAGVSIMWFVMKNSISNIDKGISEFYRSIDGISATPEFTTGFSDIDNIFKLLENKRHIFSLDFNNSASGDIIGIFEFDYSRRLLIISKSILFLFDIGECKEYECSVSIPLDRYSDYIKKYKQSLHASEENLYYYDSPEGRQWYNVFQNEGRPISFGFVINATDRIKNYQKAGKNTFGVIDSFDVLTDKMKSEMLKENECGAVVSIQLNGLKSVNDYYGYRTGNEFVKKCEQEIVSAFGEAFVGKKSSYEFIIFISGEKEEELVKTINQKFADLSSIAFEAPDSRSIKFRFNGGYSITPYDTKDFATLLRYSNYALYEAKNKYKGTIQRFKLENYSHEIYLQKKLENFRQLIDNNELDYVFQPMVNLKNGSIFAYEALMRPRNRMFTSSIEVLETAKQEGMTYMLEKLTVMNCLEIVNNNREFFRDKKLFYNTVFTQTLTKEDSVYYRRAYSDIGHILIPEVSERYTQQGIIEKCSAIKDNEGDVAIDKYTGKHTDFENILKLRPSYIKLDRSLINDISTNKDNRAFISSFVKYAKKNHITVCAVGIETYAELKEAVRLGIDYAQGFYIAMPKGEFVDRIDSRVTEEIKELNNQKIF